MTPGRPGIPTPSAVPAPARRWVALDGLRAVGVVLVVLFHADRVLDNGFLGVDIFFVLSGFLITTLLTDEIDRSGRVLLRGFYRRRALRLVPALLAVCLFVVLVAAVSGHQVAAVAAGAVASLLYVSNLWLYSGHDTPLLQHTWTLALETQFYLVWPLLIGSVRRRRWIGATLLGVAVAAAVLALVVAIGPVLSTYVRAVGLPLGCALALVLRRPPVRLWWRLSTVAAPVCLLLLVVLAALPPVTVVWDVVPSLLAVPVVMALTRSGPLTTALEWRPLVWIGERSYGLYLWHFPVLSLALNQSPSAVPEPVRVIAGIVASVAVAGLSYRFVEQPFLRRKRLTRGRSDPASSAARPSRAGAVQPDDAAS